MTSENVENAFVPVNSLPQVQKYETPLPWSLVKVSSLFQSTECQRMENQRVKTRLQKRSRLTLRMKPEREKKRMRRLGRRSHLAQKGEAARMMRRRGMSQEQNLRRFRRSAQNRQRTVHLRYLPNLQHKWTGQTDRRTRLVLLVAVQVS
jgi:hypothetical protein